ncbi:nucleic acid-binding protein [Neoconidiobolus thromboides FSU 785]|nr:nucleic acid-binding protein [Neoconidiobolus thromboides FSU 785]
MSNIIVFISEIIRGADFSGARPHFYISDGWYSIKCELDEPLRNSLLNNEFQLGQKIEITGAILQSSGSVPILESKDKLSLKLSSNGTRKACWSRKIGHQPYNWFIKEIKDIKLNGDIIPCTFGRIIRKHPFKIMIRSKSDGKSTIRTYEEELALKESTDMDESEDLTENEFTPFCALRIIDKNNTEAQITLWNISFETYNDFKEGENYCFYNLIPKRSKDRHKFNYHSVLQLNSTISTKCVNTKGSALNSHYNPALGKQLSTITSLESLEKGSNVDMCVLYLGKLYMM